MNFNNGEIPWTFLVKVPGQEDDHAYLTPTTCARWLGLKQYVLDTWDVVIWIVPGYNAYRPYDNQVIAKDAAIAEGRPFDAADPGTSSHGGKYIQPSSPRDGHASLAIDVGGYERLNRADWYAACRKFGFEPGFFSWEPWHIIDWDPQFGVTPADPIIIQGDEDMYVQWNTDPAKVVYAVSTEIGQPSMRACGQGEAAIARAGGRVVSCDEGTLKMLSKEAGYNISLGRTDVGATVASAVWNGQVIKRAGGNTSVIQELANIGTATSRPKS